jgi:myosin heavy subunit
VPSPRSLPVSPFIDTTLQAAILYNIKKRHIDGKPYTRTGDIMIAVNPFQWLAHLSTEKKRSYYSNRLVWGASEDDARDGMEPHGVTSK